MFNKHQRKINRSCDEQYSKHIHSFSMTKFTKFDYFFLNCAATLLHSLIFSTTIYTGININKIKGDFVVINKDLNIIKV